MRSTCDQVISRYVISVKENKWKDYIWCWWSTSVTDRQTGRIKERTCFQREGRAFCSILKRVKRNCSQQGVSFHSTQHGSLVLLFYPLCVLDEMHLMENLGKFGSTFRAIQTVFVVIFSLTKDILALFQDLLSCSPRQHF